MLIPTTIKTTVKKLDELNISADVEMWYPKKNKKKQNTFIVCE